MSMYENTRAILEAAKTPDDNACRSVDARIATAWMKQIVADANEWAASGDDQRRKQVAAARKLAGEYADDIVFSTPEQQPMYHKLRFSDKKVVAVSTMLASCIPLWLHYYGFVRDIVEAMDEASKT